MKKIPLFYGKPSDETIFNPKDFIRYKIKLKKIKDPTIPKNFIIVFSKNFLKHLKKKYKTKKINWISSLYDIFEFKIGDKKIGVIYFGIGAAFAGTTLEELIALGAKNFIVIGLTGSIQKNFNVGDIAIIERAIRDEGTSFHYLKPSKYAFSSKKINKHIEKVLKSKKIKYFKGAIWSTDAPYRETKKELNKYQKEGVLGVEMEAAALFAIAKYRKVNLGLLVVVSDTLHDNVWIPEFHTDVLDKSIKKVLNLSIESFKSIK